MTHLRSDLHLLGMAGELTFDPGITASTVADAAAGDVHAFARIVELHHEDMARVCYVICGDREVARECVQAAWAIAWHKLDSLRDPERLRPWLMSIAANEVRQYLRRQKRGRVVDISEIEIGSERRDPARRVEMLDLEAALRRLTPEDRALLAMRHVAGFDSPEIGVALGISAAAVRTRLSRLVARLRSELAE